LCQILRDHLGDVELLFGDTVQGITQSLNSCRRSRGPRWLEKQRKTRSVRDRGSCVGLRFGPGLPLTGP
jgi:hypothetical protein